MWNPDDQEYQIYRFNAGSQSWEETGTAIDNRDESLGDALWDGSRLYVASHIFSQEGKSTSSGNAGRLYRYTYHSNSKTYSLDSGFPVVINGAKSESLVITKDSAGKLWAAWIESKKVKINCSESSDSDWGSPFNLPVQGGNTSSDDVCSIVALNGKIGVLWSNQDQDAAYFAVHNDGDSRTDWQNRETALGGQNNLIDDHINLGTCDGDGNLSAVVKTSLTGGSDPKIYVLKRTPSGNWSKHVAGREDDGHTRPMVLVDIDNNQVYMIAKGKNGGEDAIYMKRASTGNLAFPGGMGEPLIRSNSDDDINNPTSTKQCIDNTSGLLVLASDKGAKYYFHNYIQPLGEVSNLAPFITAIPDQEMGVGETLEIEISADDPDNDNIDLSVDGLPGFGNFADNGNGSGSITFQPVNGDAGDYLIRVIAGDDGNPPLERSESFLLTVSAVNHAPQITAISDTMLEEGQLLALSIIASDEENNDITLSAANLPSFGNLTDNGNGSGTINFAPGFNDAGEYNTIEIIATDNGEPPLSTTITFNLMVNNVNRAPLLSGLSDLAMNEDETLEFTITASDPDNDDLVFAVNNLPGFGSFNAEGSNGNFQFQPGFSDAGVYENIEIILSDTGSPALSDTAMLAIIVNNVNQAPVIATISHQQVQERDTLQVDVFAEDMDGDTIELSAENLPHFAAFQDLGGGLGLVVFTPGNSSEGNYPGIKIIAKDNGVPVMESVALFNLSVFRQNAAPFANNDVVETLEDHPLQIDVLANDRDLNGDFLSIQSINSENTIGTVTFTAGDSEIAYTPLQDFSGVDAFSYTLSDGQGGTDSATVTIRIEPVNDAPVLSGLPDSLRIGFDTPARLNLHVAASDVESPVNLLDFTFQAFPDTLVLDFEENSGMLAISPQNNLSVLMVTLTITVSDPESASSEHTISIILDGNPLAIEDRPTDGIPQQMELLQNFPNPFNPTTNIGFRISDGSTSLTTGSVFVELKIYDTAGRLVKTLINENRPAGSYSVQWDATNEAGRKVGSGIYLYRIRAMGVSGQQSQIVKRMILLK